MTEPYYSDQELQAATDAYWGYPGADDAFMRRALDVVTSALAARVWADIWAEAYEAGVVDCQQSIDFDGGKTPPARVNPYRAKEAGRR